MRHIEAAPSTPDARPCQRADDRQSTLALAGARNSTHLAARSGWQECCRVEAAMRRSRTAPRADDLRARPGRLRPARWAAAARTPGSGARSSRGTRRRSQRALREALNHYRTAAVAEPASLEAQMRRGAMAEAAGRVRRGARGLRPREPPSALGAGLLPRRGHGRPHGQHRARHRVPERQPAGAAHPRRAVGADRPARDRAAVVLARRLAALAACCPTGCSARST